MKNRNITEMKNKECIICKRELANNHATYCNNGCKELAKRAKTPEREQRLEAIKRSLKNDSFHCYYTGVELNVEDSTSPFYFTFDHTIPRDSKKIVACAAFVNDMKSDLSEEEFKKYTIKLAEHFSKGIKLKQSDFSLKHFKRNSK